MILFDTLHVRLEKFLTIHHKSCAMVDGLVGFLSMDLNFSEVLEASKTRCARWHGPDSVPWTGADWSNAMCGEAGEAANVVKKLRRVETGVKGSQDPDWLELKEMLAFELADTYLYLVLVADYYNVDLASAVVEKFNSVSIREGFPERLGT